MSRLLEGLHFCHIKFRFSCEKDCLHVPRLQKMICLQLGKELRQIVPEMRPFCLSTIEIHEVLWLKMRMELRQTTASATCQLFLR
jgi:hypothetical protein